MHTFIGRFAIVTMLRWHCSKFTRSQVRCICTHVALVYAFIGPQEGTWRFIPSSKRGGEILCMLILVILLLTIDCWWSFAWSAWCPLILFPFSMQTRPKTQTDRSRKCKFWNSRSCPSCLSPVTDELMNDRYQYCKSLDKDLLIRTELQNKQPK